MTKILLIRSSSKQNSNSNMLADELLAQIKHATPVELTVEDLSAHQLANLDEAGIDVLRSQVEAPTAAQNAILELSNQLVDRLKQAEAIVIAAPMHNFTVAATLRTYFDYIARPGVSFGYDANGPHGLIDDKPVFIVSTRGGQYGDGSPQGAAAADFQSGYLRQILGFLGLTSIQIIAANGMDMGDEAKTKGLDEARTRMAEAVQTINA